MKRVLIVGAGSAIAEATARIFAERGDVLYLVGRKAGVLDAISTDLKVRHAKDVGCEILDAGNIAAHEAMLERAERFLGGLDMVLIAYGTLSDQKACEDSAELTVKELHNNAISVAALLTRVAARLEERGAGTVAVLSSVAGDRGRRSNYVYGSAKALVTAFTSGLRQRLRKCGVNVITIKPGLVDSPMTAAFKKGFLWAQPRQVAAGIVRAIDRSASVVYLPPFWRPIMLVIKAVPEWLFLRLPL